MYKKLTCLLLVFSCHAIQANMIQNDQAKLMHKPTIVVMGDSLSAAYGMSENQGWVALLEQRLKDKGYHYAVVNGSVSGATTQAGLQRLPVLLKRYQPKIVLLELGANDGLRGQPIAGITQNLRTLINLSRKEGAKVVLLGIRIPPNFGSRYTEPFFNQFAQLAQEFNLPYVPFLLEGVAGNTSTMLPDGLHPNASGQPIILENVWPIVQPLLEKNSDKVNK